MMNQQHTAYIIDGLRSPIGRLGGSLSGIRTDNLAAWPIRELIKKHKLEEAAFDELYYGCANQAGEDNRNVARMAALLAGMSWNVPAETINRLCASGMSAVAHCTRAIWSGDGDLFIGGGIEHMTRSPMVMAKSANAFGRDHRMYDTTFGWRFINSAMKSLYGTEAMGETAENLAEKYNLSREAQDRFALASQQKAAAAWEAGHLQEEICTIEIPRRKKETLVFSKDEFMRPESSLEGLAKLRAVFRDGGSVTAGNASGMNDGAAALLIASDAGLAKNNLKPLAKVLSTGRSGVEPRIMGIGPVEASNQALAKAGLSMDDMDVIELNEAFASQCLACMQEWGLSEDDPRINPNGGSIALGHPLGMSGARVTLAAANELKRSKKKYALATMCVGVGQGFALVLENAE